MIRHSGWVFLYFFRSLNVRMCSACFVGLRMMMCSFCISISTPLINRMPRFWAYFFALRGKTMRLWQVKERTRKFFSCAWSIKVFQL